MLDDRELALSFLLSATCCFFWRRVISSTKVAGEAVLVISVSRVARMTETPFSTTRIALAPRLERRLFFLALILVYIPWLNFVVIPTRGEHLLKKKKKHTHTIVMSQMDTYSPSPQFQRCARWRLKVLGQGNAGLKCEDRRGRRQFSHAQWPLQRLDCTCSWVSVVS